MTYEETSSHFTQSRTRAVEMATSPNELFETFYYCKNTGHFLRLSTREITGRTGHGGYKYLSYKGVQLLAHRVAFAMGHGRWPVNQVDHIDGNRQNNALYNLRDITRSENNRNTDRARGLTPAQRARGGSAMVGIKVLPSGRFRAAFKWQGKQYYAGTHGTPEEAQAARKAKMIEVGCLL